MPGGRPTKYKPKYCKELIQFFDIEPTTITDDGKERAVVLPTIERFCCNIGVHVDTFYEWENRHPEFSEAAKKARQAQKAIWQENSLKGRYNTPFTIFMGKNVFGWTDKTEHAINISIEDKIKSLAAPEEPKQIEGTATDAE